MISRHSCSTVQRLSNTQLLKVQVIKALDLITTPDSSLLYVSRIESASYENGTKCFYYLVVASFCSPWSASTKPSRRLDWCASYPWNLRCQYRKGYVQEMILRYHFWYMLSNSSRICNQRISKSNFTPRTFTQRDHSQIFGAVFPEYWTGCSTRRPRT